MEHLPGQTLADRLLKGPLPLAQALDIAAQIADALDAAHKHGIVHRDLKPGNFMLTTSGTGRSGVIAAKLLDFGLAKLKGHGERPALVSASIAPTQAAPITARGTILGTLQYMAPEQLEGREADARTDLWALGAILCEMLTGKRAFEGDSQVSLIGNIMNAEPAPVSTLQPVTPPGVDRLVRRCLAEAPEDRPDTAHDVANGSLRKVAVAGGPATTLCDTAPVFGASWGENDTIVFARDLSSLFQVPAAGGTATALTTLDEKRGEVSHRLPHLLPGAKVVLFTAVTHYLPDWDNSEIVAQSVDGKTRKTIALGADARYLPTGHLLFVRSGKAVAAGFDAERLEVTGGEVTVLNDVMQAANTPNSAVESGAGQLATSSTGIAAYATGGIFRDQERVLVWVDRSGREIFYTEIDARTQQTRMMSVPATPGARLAVGLPRVLFEGTFRSQANTRGYDVTPDGRRFLTVKPKPRPRAPSRSWCWC